MSLANLKTMLKYASNGLQRIDVKQGTLSADVAAHGVFCVSQSAVLFSSVLRTWIVHCSPEAVYMYAYLYASHSLTLSLYTLKNKCNLVPRIQLRIQPDDAAPLAFCIPTRVNGVVVLLHGWLPILPPCKVQSHAQPGPAPNRA